MIVPEIARADLEARESRALIDALDRELTAAYPEPGATHFRLDPGEVAEGRGAFLVARRAGEPAGCGAVRRIAEGVFEVKRMYVGPPWRGRGVGRALLVALEREARRLGARRIVLETGLRQAAALALYGRSGYGVIPPFGEYTASPVSVCMGKDVGEP